MSVTTIHLTPADFPVTLQLDTPAPVPAPPLNSKTLAVGASKATLLAALQDMSIDVLDVPAGLYKWAGMRIDGIDRSARPLVVRAQGMAQIDNAGTGAINEAIMVGYVSAVKGIRFIAGAGRWQFQNFTLQQSGLIHVTEAADFEWSGVNVRACGVYSGSSGSTEWSVYVSHSSSRVSHSQRLTFDDWDVQPGNVKFGGFQSYQGSTNGQGDGPAGVSARGWKVQGGGTALVCWGDGTGYDFADWTISGAQKSLSVTGKVQGAMTNVHATGSVNPRVANAPGMTYTGCSFDR